MTSVPAQGITGNDGRKCPSPRKRSSSTGTASRNLTTLGAAASKLNLGSTTTSKPSTYAVLTPRFYPAKLRPPIWPMPIKAREWSRIDQRLHATMTSIFEGNLPWPLFLHGEPGAGKSCAGLVAVDWCGEGVYITMSDFCQALIDAQQGRIPFCLWDGAHPRTESTLWYEWSDANLCVLDEVGLRDNVSDHHYDTLTKALDLRNDAGKPLIVISNIDAKEIAGVYDDRIGSRVSSGTVVQVSGDRRIRHGATAEVLKP